MTRNKGPRKQRTFSNRPLADLGKLQKQARGEEPRPRTRSDGGSPGPSTGPPQGTDDPDVDDDQRLFSSAMRGVQPFGPDRRKREPDRSPPPTPVQDDEESREVMQALRDLIAGEAPLSIHETDEAIEGSIEGLDPRILRKLRSGELSVQDHLDLHGCTREEAREKVQRFLLQAIAQGKRCVLVIHGRGRGSKDRIPVLKNALKNWFTRRALRKEILAFTTARPVDGGAGAVYVLLRKHGGRP